MLMSHKNIRWFLGGKGAQIPEWGYCCPGHDPKPTKADRKARKRRERQQVRREITDALSR